MTSDKVLRNELKNAETELLQLVGVAAQTRDKLHRFSKRMDDDDELRNYVTFRYDFTEDPDNKLVSRIQKFMAENTPEGFEINTQLCWDLARCARALEPHSVYLRAEISWDTFHKMLGLAFQLGYINGWKNKRFKSQKAAQ